MKRRACDCPKCRQMCERSTCLPTPDQARALVRAGHARRLAVYLLPGMGKPVIGPAPRGFEGTAKTLQSTRMDAPCTFLAEGRCELHDAGLKPLEGCLAMHDEPDGPPRFEVLRQWVPGRRAESALATLRNALQETPCR